VEEEVIVYVSKDEATEKDEQFDHEGTQAEQEESAEEPSW